MVLISPFVLEKMNVFSQCRYILAFSKGVVLYLNKLGDHIDVLRVVSPRLACVLSGIMYLPPFVKLAGLHTVISSPCRGTVAVETRVRVASSTAPLTKLTCATL